MTYLKTKERSIKNRFQVEILGISDRMSVISPLFPKENGDRIL
jgi:hypothetical protein